MNKKERLEQLRKEINNIEISYSRNYDEIYADLINVTNDYQYDNQSWEFEGIFEDYIDDDILKEMVEYNLKEFGVWAVRNLLDDIKDEYGVYKIDAYGYGHDITLEELEDIKQKILDTIETLEKE